MTVSSTLTLIIIPIILLIAGALIQIFIKRTFKAIDTKFAAVESRIKWLEDYAEIVNDSLGHLNTQIAVVQTDMKDIPEIKDCLADINKFRFDMGEKYQLKQDSTDRLQEINKNLERLLDKVTNLNGKK